MQAILSYTIFLPLLTAIALAIFRLPFYWIRVGAVLSSLAVISLVLYIIAHFDPSAGTQFIRILPWIQSYGIAYFVGVDAFSLVLLTLISLLMPLLYLYMWHEERKGYWYNMLMLQTAVTGAVLALDMVLFYLFWEAMLLPIFIMIGRYGSGLRQYNAMKILLMTIFGSMSMLGSILYMGYTYHESVGIWSFALHDLQTLTHDPRTTVWLAGGFLIAFAIKVPLIGFHTWMAPAYGSSPTPAVVIMSAIMAKLGIYGLWRFGYGLFASTMEYYATILIIFSIIGMIYYAIRAISEPYLRKMFAYASGSHLSLIAVGLFVTNIYGWGGSLYFVGTHALASAGIFLMIGLLYKRAGTTQIDSLGGIATVAPRFAFFFAFFALSIAGVPGTGGFVAELLIIIGAFKASLWFGFFTATTMLLAMLYIFWMLQRTLFGEPSSATVSMDDLRPREMLMLLPLVLLLLLTGVAPSLFVPTLEPLLSSTLLVIIPALGGAL